MKPKSVKLFQILGWCTVGAIGLVLLLGLVVLLQYARYVPATAWLMVLLQIGIAVGMAISIPMVAQRRSPVGRGLYVGLGGLFLLLQLVSMATGANSNVVAILIVLVLLGLIISSTIFLFQPDTNAWLAQGPLARPAPAYPQAGGYPPQPGAGWGTPPAQPYGTPPAPPAGGGYPGAGEQTAFAPPQPPQPEPASYAPPPPEPTYAPPPPQAAPGPPAASASGGTRTCPFCAEEIKAEAIKCRFCGSAVEPVTR